MNKHEVSKRFAHFLFSPSSQTHCKCSQISCSFVLLARFHFSWWGTLSLVHHREYQSYLLSVCRHYRAFNMPSLGVPCPMEVPIISFGLLFHNAKSNRLRFFASSSEAVRLLAPICSLRYVGQQSFPYPSISQWWNTHRLLIHRHAFSD